MKYQEYDFRSDQEKSNGNGAAMLDYLRSFDPICEKYEIRIWDNEYKNWQSNALKVLLSTSGRANASAFEASFQFGAISKHKYSSILDNLKLVYGDAKLIHNDVLAYHLVERKIVHGFLAIPQLDKMFDEDYFNFEWDMHVGQDFNEHRSDYYRDHFIHQIRDMYMMLVLLEDFGFYHATRAVLTEKTASNISTYVCKKKELFLSDTGSPVFRKLSELCDQMQNHVINKLSYAEEYFYNYVIKASCMLAGLFHDMGYPICHFLQTRNRLSNYNPTMFMVTHNEIGSFDQIASILSPSLLFALISLKDIKTALNVNKKGKYDHGAYSAIAFLLQFYNNGLIFSLPHEKQCAIELAAVAIFNHTIEYRATKQKSKSIYYSLYYRQNPIAFLLRVCDDLQEWDRRYFEVSESSDLMFCKKCHTPLIKYKQASDSESDYRCFCSDIIRRPDIFMKRKLYLVSMADIVSFSVAEAGEKRIIRSCVKYDLYKLLIMTNINSTYAKFRYKELSGLQKLLEGQNYGQSIYRFNIDFFMSPNPVLIKLEIIKRFVETKDLLTLNHTSMMSNYSDRLLLLYDHPELLVDCLEWQLNDQRQTEVLMACIKFYISLLIKKDNTLSHRRYHSSAIEAYKLADPLYYKVMTLLVADALQSAEDRQGSIEYVEPSKEALLYDYIDAYTNINNAFNSFDNIRESEKSIPYIGFYFDICLFKCMWDKIKGLSD